MLRAGGAAHDVGVSPPRFTLSRDSGQAAVETALTMPLMLFFILTILQMGMLMQARNLTQYAVFRATRAGSVNHGNCVPMMHAAVASLIPSFVSFAGGITGAGTMGSKLGNAFSRVMPASVPPYVAKFDPTMTGGQAPPGFTESIVWLVKERPTIGELTALDLNNGEFSDWDQGDDSNGGGTEPLRLEVRMIYWYPLRLPFIDWVFSRVVLAQWGLLPYSSQAPYMPVRTATNWSAYTTNPLATDSWEMIIKNELVRRIGLKQYSFPLLASYRMRMMTPPRTLHFLSPTCGYLP